MNNFIKVKPGPPEEKAPKGTKCYNLYEGVIYEQMDGLRKNKWEAVNHNVNLDGQMFVQFLLNTSENVVDLSTTVLAPAPTTTGGSDVNIAISNMV